MTQNPFQPAQPPAPPEPLLPQNLGAEAGVLGSLLIDPDAIRSVKDFLRADDFYREAHRAIFQTMIDLYERYSSPSDVITLTDELSRRGKLEDIGGLSYVSSLANQVPTSANVEYYARIVERTSILRRLIHAAGQIAAVAYNQPDAEVASREAERLVKEAITRKRLDGSVTFGEAASRWMEQVQQAIDLGRTNGILTGFTPLDVAIGGLRPKHLVYLAARTSMGKTDVARSIAENIARRFLKEAQAADRAPDTIEYITLEMGASEMVTRTISRYAKIDSKVIDADFFNLKDGLFLEDMHARALHGLGNAVLTLDPVLRYRDLPLDMRTLSDHLSRAVDETRCKIAFIDHLHLVIDRERDLYARLTNLSRQLKQLAQRLEIPIFCLLQMNRQADSRANKRPTLADLRDSGSLEEDCNIALGLYAPSYYHPERMNEHNFGRFMEVWVMKARGSDKSWMEPFYYDKPTHDFRSWNVEEDGQWPIDDTRQVALPVDAGTVDELTHQRWWNNEPQGRWDLNDN